MGLTAAAPLHCPRPGHPTPWTPLVHARWRASDGRARWLQLRVLLPPPGLPTRVMHTTIRYPSVLQGGRLKSCAKPVWGGTCSRISAVTCVHAIKAYNHMEHADFICDKRSAISRSTFLMAACLQWVPKLHTHAFATYPNDQRATPAASTLVPPILVAM